MHIKTAKAHIKTIKATEGCIWHLKECIFSWEGASGEVMAATKKRAEWQQDNQQNERMRPIAKAHKVESIDRDENGNSTIALHVPTVAVAITKWAKSMAQCPVHTEGENVQKATMDEKATIQHQRHARQGMLNPSCRKQ